MADRQSGRGARAGEADEVFRGDIRYEQRCANEEPSHVAAREEVILGSPLLPGKVHTNSEDDGEVDADDDEIRSRKGPVINLDSRCKQHPCLLDAAIVRLSPA